MTRNSSPTRGFVTMATGKKEYYVLARNLLFSYRLHNPQSLPFAIICDQENDITALFDDVVVMDSPSFSVLDKLKLLELIPYDETIFIDADSLICRNLDTLWDIACKSHDVGIFGAVWDPDTEEGRKQLERAGRLRPKMHFLCTCQGGMYYIRKSPALAPFLDLCLFIRDNFDEFRGFARTPTDDNIIPLVCSVYDFPPAEDWLRIFCWLPESRIMNLDIVRGSVSYYWKAMKDRDLGPDCYFIHFGNKQTREWLYRRESYRMLCAVAGKTPSRLTEGMVWIVISAHRLFNDARYRAKVLAYKVFSSITMRR